MSKNEQFVRFDKVDKSYDGKVLVVKDLNLDMDVEKAESRMRKHIQKFHRTIKQYLLMKEWDRY